MLHRPFGLALWLAAAPLAAQLPDLSTFHSGAMHLELAPDQTSQIEMDLDHLEAVLCGESLSVSRSFMPPGETCRLVIANDGSNGLMRGDGKSPLVVAAPSLLRPPCAGAQLTLVPTGVNLMGEEPIHLSCGSWSFKASIHVGSSAPPSIFSLYPPLAGSPTGLFAGPLNLLMDFLYEKESSGATYSESRALFLDAAGRWTVVQTSTESPYELAATETNLALFIDRESGLGGSWYKRAGCATARKGCTRLCLQGSTAVVTVLNGGPGPVL